MSENYCRACGTPLGNDRYFCGETCTLEFALFVLRHEPGLGLTPYYLARRKDQRDRRREKQQRWAKAR